MSSVDEAQGPALLSAVSAHSSPPAAATAGAGAAEAAAAAARAAAGARAAGAAGGAWRDVMLEAVGTPSTMRAHLSPKTTPT